MEPSRASVHTLVLLRHAKSDWAEEVADIARPLGKRGRRQAPEAGRWLDAGLGRIDLAVVSPAARAWGTWELASAELAMPPDPRLDDRVYAASAEELLAVVRELSDDLGTVLIVGHNPGLEDLVMRLTDEWVPMPTSGIAVVEVRGSWATAGRQPGFLRAAGRPPAR